VGDAGTVAIPRIPRAWYRREAVDLARLEELYRVYAPLVHARARRIVGDDADDVVQDVFVRLIQKPPPQEGVVSWIYVASNNACIDRLRHRNRRSTDWEEAVSRHMELHRGEDLEATLLDRALCRTLLGRMPEKIQQVVMLVVFDELSTQDAADVLRISRKTVTHRLEKFRESAAKMVQRWQT
jgi:RNA polymerase sigma-70 factor, ECF subfamily